MFKKLQILFIMALAFSLLPACGAAAGGAGNKAFGVIEIANNAKSVEEAAVRLKYENLTRSLIQHKLTITAMESCTAGQIASLLTDTEGSSAIIKGAFVTYSNEAKIMQGVPKEIISAHGVYSPETAAAMAAACRKTYEADLGVGVTGSFGNTDPNNPDSVPGEVFFAIASKEGIKCYHCSVPPQASRLQYKLYMANLIADELLKKL